MCSSCQDCGPACHQTRLLCASCHLLCLLASLAWTWHGQDAPSTRMVIPAWQTLPRRSSSCFAHSKHFMRSVLSWSWDRSITLHMSPSIELSCQASLLHMQQTTGAPRGPILLIELLNIRAQRVQVPLDDLRTIPRTALRCRCLARRKEVKEPVGATIGAYMKACCSSVAGLLCVCCKVAVRVLQLLMLQCSPLSHSDRVISGRCQLSSTRASCSVLASAVSRKPLCRCLPALSLFCAMPVKVLAFLALGVCRRACCWPMRRLTPSRMNDWLAACARSEPD